jgi:hypothetical protein
MLQRGLAFLDVARRCPSTVHPFCSLVSKQSTTCFTERQFGRRRHWESPTALPQIVELFDDGENLWLPSFTPGRAYAISIRCWPRTRRHLRGCRTWKNVLDQEGDLIVLAPRLFRTKWPGLLALRRMKLEPVLRSPRELYPLFYNAMSRRGYPRDT